MKNEPFLFSWDEVEETLEELIAYHQKKLVECGRRIVPNVTFDDLLQPNDFPALENHPYFRYEEGILSGIETARSALRAARKQKTT